MLLSTIIFFNINYIICISITHYKNIILRLHDIQRFKDLYSILAIIIVVHYQ